MKDTDELEITGMDLLTDNPIDEPEQDRLNRKTFAKNLAQSLFSYNEDSCFTVGIYGQWGSGKSSLLNLIEKYLDRIPKSGGYVILMHVPEQIGRRSGANRPPFRSKSATPAGQSGVTG